MANTIALRLRHHRRPRLRVAADGNYTISCQCDDASVKVLEAIARVPRSDKNHPIKPILFQHITTTPTRQ